MDDMNELSIWSKKQSDVTVGDSVKVALVTGTVMALVPVVIMAGVAGVTALVEKRKMAKAGRVAIVEANDEFDN